jgi:hypothetical protein
MKLSRLHPNIFGRVLDDGTVILLDSNEGMPITRLNVDGIYPVGSHLSTRYEHPEGIRLTRNDAKRLGIYMEKNR